MTRRFRSLQLLLSSFPLSCLAGETREEECRDRDEQSGQCVVSEACVDISGEYLYTEETQDTLTLSQTGCDGTSSHSWNFTVRGSVVYVAVFDITGNISDGPPYTILWSNGFTNWPKQAVDYTATWAALEPLQHEVREMLAPVPGLPFRDGGSMPAIFLGTGGLTGSDCKRIVEYALRSGYRAVDTALMYSNHEAISEALKASGLPRGDVYLASKVPLSMMGFELAEQAIQLMLSQMQVEYLDLCMMHWPGQEPTLRSIDDYYSREASGNITEDEEWSDVWLRWSMREGTPRTDAYEVVERAGTWRALEKAHREGRCRHLGVSNFRPQHLEELLDYAVVPPVVNQIEYHPYQVDTATVETCRKYGIAVQAYGSMGTPRLREEPVIRRIASETGRSIPQVLLRWAVQEGTIVIPRTSKEERVLQNAKLWDFSLTAEQQAAMSALHSGHRTYSNPDDSPVGVYQKRRPWQDWHVQNLSRDEDG